MLTVFDRSSHTLTRPSLPDVTRDVRDRFAMVSTALRDVVATPLPESVCTPCKVDLSNKSMTFEGEDAEAA